MYQYKYGIIQKNLKSETNILSIILPFISLFFSALYTKQIKRFCVRKKYSHTIGINNINALKKNFDKNKRNILTKQDTNFDLNKTISHGEMYDEINENIEKIIERAKEQQYKEKILSRAILSFEIIKIILYMISILIFIIMSKQIIYSQVIGNYVIFYLFAISCVLSLIVTVEVMLKDWKKKR